MKILGFPDEYLLNGTSEELFRHYGLSFENLIHEVEIILNSHNI
jgi:transketolase C-terminal domain/subunit